MIDIDELESLAKAATPGPWWCFNDPHENMIEGKNCQWVLGLSQDGCPFHDGIEKTLGEYCSSGFECPVCVDVSEADLEYITAACNAVPELVARIRELESEHAGR